VNSGQVLNFFEEMISVSTIKGPLQAGKYEEVWRLMTSHFEGPEKDDLVAAGKVLGLVSFFLQFFIFIIFVLKN
jgi:hypothetical protein